MRTRLLAALLLSAAAAAPGGRAWAGGGRPGGIFEYSASGRASGMGGAYTALADDAAALYHNPAGLGRVRGHEIALLRANLFGGASYDYLGYARQGRTGGWGAHLVRLNLGGLEGRDENNLPAGGFTYAETGLAFGFGSNAFFDRSLALGGSFKVLSRSLGGASSRLLGLDLGAQVFPELWDRRLSLGAKISNPLRMKMGDTDDDLSLLVKAGFGLRLLPGLVFGANVSSEKDFELGTEYSLGPASLRAGFREMGPSFGAGLRFLKRWHADFAVSNHSSLGMATQISLGCRLGEGRAVERVKSRYQDLRAQAERSFEDRRYLESLALFERMLATNLDEREPGRVRDAGRVSRLKALAAALDLEKRPERAKALSAGGEQGESGRESIRALMEGDDLKSLLLAQAAHGAAPDAEAFRALLHAVSKTTFQRPAQDELLPAAQLVDLKLRKALSSFEAERYEEAAEHCRQVLLLDPNSALAHERLGSAYFALELKSKALFEWREALRLRPGNDSLRDFLKRIGEAP